MEVVNRGDVHGDSTERVHAHHGQKGGVKNCEERDDGLAGLYLKRPRDREEGGTCVCVCVCLCVVIFISTSARD